MALAWLGFTPAAQGPTLSVAGKTLQVDRRSGFFSASAVKAIDPGRIGDTEARNLQEEAGEEPGAVGVDLVGRIFRAPMIGRRQPARGFRR